MGSGAPRSPLLATWMMSQGKLEKTGTELKLSVKELIQDLHDWPTDHVVVRQRESDALLEKLRAFEGKTLTNKERNQRIKLREELGRLTDAEDEAARAIMLMLADPIMSVWLLKIWRDDDDAPRAVEAFVNSQLWPRKDPPNASGVYLRMSPPSDPERRCSTDLSREDVSSIMEIMQWRQKKFGHPLTETVAELPAAVRARVAIPRIIRGLFEWLNEDRLTWDQIQQMNALDIGHWTVSIG
jgi:hypothetical protein